jgi:hypothetical protein
MIELLIAQIIIINSYTFGGAPAVGGAGNITQEDGTALFQQDGISKFQKQFTSTGNILQQDGTSQLLQQDGVSKLQQQ